MSKRDFYLHKSFSSKSNESRVFYYEIFKRYIEIELVLFVDLVKSTTLLVIFVNIRTTFTIWKGVKEIISLKSCSIAKPISLKINDTVTSDALLVANFLNSFISSVASNTRSRIPESSKHFTSFLNRPSLNSIFISPITSDEVSKLISSMPLKILVLMVFHKDS